MSSQQKLVSIDDKTKQLVYGFIRESFVIIPNELMELILLFYIIIETFDKGIYHKDFALSESKNGPENAIVSVNNDGWKSIFGSFKIDALKLKKCMIEWTFDFKVNNKRNVASFFVGIVGEDAINKMDEYCFGHKSQTFSKHNLNHHGYYQMLQQKKLNTYRSCIYCR